jgi:hypothetical protein
MTEGEADINPVEKLQEQGREIAVQFRAPGSRPLTESQVRLQNPQLAGRE